METTDGLLLMHNLHYANFRSCKISKCPPASPLCVPKVNADLPSLSKRWINLPNFLKAYHSAILMADRSEQMAGSQHH